MLARIMLTAVLLVPATLAGQDRSSSPLRTDRSPYSIRFDGGLAELHSAGNWGPLLGLRFGRYVDPNRILGVVLSLTGALADASYGSLQLGVDVRLPIHPDVRPTLSGRGGLMLEEGWVGDILEGSAGVAIRFGNERWLRLDAQVGQHSDYSGPRGFTIGLEQPL